MTDTRFIPDTRLFHRAQLHQAARLLREAGRNGDTAAANEYLSVLWALRATDDAMPTKLATADSDWRRNQHLDVLRAYRRRLRERLNTPNISTIPSRRREINDRIAALGWVFETLGAA